MFLLDIKPSKQLNYLYIVLNKYSHIKVLIYIKTKSKKDIKNIILVNSWTLLNKYSHIKVLIYIKTKKILKT